MGLLKDRAETLNQLADGAMLFCAPYTAASPELQAEHIDDAARSLLADFAQKAQALPDWTTEALDALIKAILAEHGLKMPKLAIPLRLVVTGQKQTPAIGAEIERAHVRHPVTHANHVS